MKKGFALTKNISIELRVVQGSTSNGRTDFNINLFSNVFSNANIAFMYKKDMLDEWHEDMSIESSMARYAENNKLYGLPCSNSGSKSVITWNHQNNGLASGMRCIVKAYVIPMFQAACATDYYSRVETVINNNESVVQDGILGNIVCFTPLGQYISIYDDNVYIIDKTSLETLLTIDSLDKPIHATYFNQNFIIAESNGQITEFDQSGNILNSFNASSIAFGEGITISTNNVGNILIAGYDIPVISEIVWGGTDHGTVVWDYSSPLQLIRPGWATYGDSINQIICCDLNKIFMINKSYVPQQVTILDHFTNNDLSISFSLPSFCLTFNEIVYIAEKKGRPDNFVSVANQHPSLIRAGLFSSDDINSLSQLSGMCFVPLQRTIK